MIQDPTYNRARASTVASLNNANDHIAPGGSDEVHNTLSDHYSDNPHDEHLDYYTHESYPINMALYSHHNEGGDPKKLPDEDINDISHDDIKGLDKALKVNKTPKPMTVFSGVGFNPGQMAAKHPQNRLYMPAYTSTSIGSHEASWFSKPLAKNSEQDSYDPAKDKNKEGADHHMLRINLPKGHPGSYIGDLSNHPDEKEFLLPRQQTMQVNPKPEVHEFEHNGVTHRMHIWDATPVTTKLPKPIKESTTTADARGLGYVTGAPAVDGAVTTNDVDSLFFRGNLKHSIRQSENPLAKMIGFKSFDPDKLNTRGKSLPYYDDDPNGDLLLRDKIRNKNKNNNATRG